MVVYLSLLRAINVGGKNRLKMNDLQRLYESIGLHSVTTYLQSGNVMFLYEEDSCLELEEKISIQIKKECGLEVSVLVLSLDTLCQIIDRNLFLWEGERDRSLMYVTFLFAESLDDCIGKVREHQKGEDEFLFTDRAIYLYCEKGYGKTKYNTTFWEKKLQVRATTRSWKTVTEILELAKERYLENDFYVI